MTDAVSCMGDPEGSHPIRSLNYETTFWFTSGAEWFLKCSEIALHQAHSIANSVARLRTAPRRSPQKASIAHAVPEKRRGGMLSDASEAGAIAALSALNSAALAQAPNPIGGVTSDGPKIWWCVAAASFKLTGGLPAVDRDWTDRTHNISAQ